MKFDNIFFWVLMAGASLTIIYAGITYIPHTENIGVASPTLKCNPIIWNYVYHPDRLPTKTDCRTITGTVEWVKHEDDGDFHIRLQLDDPKSAPVNSKNIGGYLVVEPICQTDKMPKPKQADAVQSCANYVSAKMPQWTMPKVGDHLKTTGFYTLDKEHGWMEMHSVLEMALY